MNRLLGALARTLSGEQPAAQPSPAPAPEPPPAPEAAAATAAATAATATASTSASAAAGAFAGGDDDELLFNDLPHMDPPFFFSKMDESECASMPNAHDFVPEPMEDDTSGLPQYELVLHHPAGLNARGHRGC